MCDTIALQKDLKTMLLWEHRVQVKTRQICKHLEKKEIYGSFVNLKLKVIYDFEKFQIYCNCCFFRLKSYESWHSCLHQQWLTNVQSTIAPSTFSQTKTQNSNQFQPYSFRSAAAQLQLHTMHGSLPFLHTWQQPPAKFIGHCNLFIVFENIYVAKRKNRSPHQSLKFSSYNMDCVYMTFLELKTL